MSSSDASSPDALRNRRHLMGLTQANIAERLGVSRATWADWERGFSKPPRYLPLALTELERQMTESEGLNMQTQMESIVEAAVDRIMTEYDAGRFTRGNTRPRTRSAGTPALTETEIDSETLAAIKALSPNERFELACRMMLQAKGYGI